MRKNTYLSLLIGLLMVLISAQVLKGQNNPAYTFGLRVEPSLSWTSVDSKNISSGKNQLNFSYGLTANKLFSDKIAVSLGVNILNLGSSIYMNNAVVRKSNITDTLSQLNIDYSLRYLELPIMLTMMSSLIKDKRFYGEFGISNGFLLRAKGDIYGGSINLKEVNVNNPDDADKIEISSVDNNSYVYSQQASAFRVGGIIGAGVLFRVLNDSYINTGIRFNLGLNNFLKEDKWRVVNNSVSLNLAFIF